MYIYMNYADAKPCSIDVKCGSHSTCMVDSLFPKTPICKCDGGFKKTKNGKYVGELILVLFLGNFRSVFDFFLQLWLAYMKPLLLSYLLLPVTETVKPDPVDFLSSSSEHLASPVPGEILNFTRPVCGFPGATFTYPACIICICLKKAKQGLDRKGQPAGKFADPVTFFSENPVRIEMPLGLLQRDVYLEIIQSAL